MDRPHDPLCKPGRALAIVLVIFFTAGASSTAQSRNRVLFTQDLERLGYKFHYQKNDNVMWGSADLAFLSEDLVLVSVRETGMEELHPKVLPGGTPMYDNPAGTHTSPDSLSMLLLFSVDQKKVLRSAKFPVQKNDGTVQATRNGQFLMISSFGLHLCSSELQCGQPLPMDGRLYVSPRRTRALVAEDQFMRQYLIDTDTLALLDGFPPRAPEVIPGDSSLLLAEYRDVIVRTPGRKDVHPGFYITSISPEVRFLDKDKVIGIRMKGITNGKATAVSFDGTTLYAIEVKEAWRGHTQFFTSVSGLRFGIAELYHSRLRSFINFFDITDSQPYNRIRVRVFETASGKAVFESHWDPSNHRGDTILPALSPAGRRLALIRNGELQVYEIP